MRERGLMSKKRSEKNERDKKQKRVIMKYIEGEKRIKEGCKDLEKSERGKESDDEGYRKKKNL